LGRWPLTVKASARSGAGTAGRVAMNRDGTIGMLGLNPVLIGEGCPGAHVPAGPWLPGRLAGAAGFRSIIPCVGLGVRGSGPPG